MEYKFGISYLLWVTLCISISALDDKNSYKLLYKTKRKLHKTAIDNIRHLDDQIKKNKMVGLLLDKIFETLQTSQVNLIQGGLLPGDDLPTNDTLKEAYAILLENVAFLCDLSLFLPSSVHIQYDNNASHKLLAGWAFMFANSSSVLDKTDTTMITLAAQELNLIPRGPDFINPYDINKKTVNHTPESSKSTDKKKMKTSKKGKQKKGPKLSGRSFSDL